MECKPLSECLNSPLPQRIRLAIEAVVGDEPAEYVADELVELAEEILQHLAAVGFIYYHRSTRQKEVYNDFLIQLFNSSGHDFNAGPLYRWSANMIKDLNSEMSEDIYGLYWEHGQLNKAIHHLSELRNQVMHGFFVLPPERNMQEANHIANLLQLMIGLKLFSLDDTFHFFKAFGYSGQWQIKEACEWDLLKNETSFGHLTRFIVLENSEQFWSEQSAKIEANEFDIPDVIKQFVLSSDKGALAYWVSPNNLHPMEAYCGIVSYLQSQKNITCIAYQLNEQGLTYTGGFLMKRIIEVLGQQAEMHTKGKKPEAMLKLLRKQHAHKVVVVIQNIHLAMFSPQHLSQIVNVLYENNIQLIAIGHAYEHLNTAFNQMVYEQNYAIGLPQLSTAKLALHNYLRFKGPSKDRQDQVSDVEQLEYILSLVLQELKDGKKLYARRFADAHQLDLEFVHEIFALLYPWVVTGREAFEADALDELYGFPSHMTEVTPIYLSLGRRDLRLEYQHKVISI